MSQTYCYWSVCDGPYAAMMQHCVDSARRVGVFKEFHVLTDRPIEDCACYEAYECEKNDGLFKLHYLKVGMSRLCFDYFVWIDADTVFLRNPTNVLGCLGRSPLHVPLEFQLVETAENLTWQGIPCRKLLQMYKKCGVANDVYLSGSAFWIVHRNAIDEVYNLALKFWRDCKEDGTPVMGEIALGFAMQMLCSDPEAHLLAKHPNLWATCAGSARDPGHIATSWTWAHPLGGAAVQVRPAIAHVPDSKPVP